MTLRGGAFLIMWHDIAPEAEEEYHHWHSKQHMPERLGHPGFRRSRRGVNWEYDRQRYFTLYEGDELATFVSEDYLRSLNGPTEWTSRMAPHFRNFLRIACEMRHSEGRGVGGAISSLQGRFPGDCNEEGFLAKLKPYLGALLREPSVSGVHVGAARPEFSSHRTRETDLRPEMSEAALDFVLVVESFGLRELARVAPDAEAALVSLGAREIVSQSYDMAYCLEDDSR